MQPPMNDSAKNIDERDKKSASYGNNGQVLLAVVCDYINDSIFMFCINDILKVTNKKIKRDIFNLSLMDHLSILNG